MELLMIKCDNDCSFPVKRLKSLKDPVDQPIIEFTDDEDCTYTRTFESIEERNEWMKKHCILLN